MSSLSIIESLIQNIQITLNNVIHSEDEHGSSALNIKEMDVYFSEGIKIDYISRDKLALSDGRLVSILSETSLTALTELMKALESIESKDDYNELIITCGDTQFDNNQEDELEHRRHHLICPSCLNEAPQLKSLLVDGSVHGDHDQCSVSHCRNTKGTKAIRLDKNALLTYPIVPANGYIEVKAKSLSEAEDMMRETLSANPNIFCDWLSPQIIPDERV